MNIFTKKIELGEVFMGIKFPSSKQRIVEHLTQQTKILFSVVDPITFYRFLLQS